MSRRHRALARVLALAGLLACAVPAAAHAGGLSPSQEAAAVPQWLFLLTGGGAVAGSFLLTAWVTDRHLIADLHALGPSLPSSAAVRDSLAPLGRILGLVGLLIVLVVGAIGPAEPLANLALVVVWGAWWSGYTMSVYLVGNTWPAINPWRTLASRLPGDSAVHYPERLGSWPAVAGLLGLVWLEVVTPVAEDPRLLTLVVAGYTLVTVAGAVTVGPEIWFDRVDPVARVFRFYGTIAPVQRSANGLALAWPGSGVTRGDLVDGFDDVGFVIALLWVTSFDGLVATSAWAGFVRAVVAAGLPPLLAYALAMLAGYGLFLGAFRLASRLVRPAGDVLVATPVIERWFAPTLLPIAAGYHLAHYLEYFLRLLPTLGALLGAPLSPPAHPPMLSIPGWFGGLAVAFVVLGHLLAVWVAHGRAFELFTGRLQPIRSQYPYIVVMILYTMTSLWLISQPYTAPPYT